MQDNTRFEELENYYLDTKTGIHWAKFTTGIMDWNEAMSAPEGWQLPDVQQLYDIVYAKLPNMLLKRYWSSTTNLTQTWVVDFFNGNRYYVNYDQQCYVRYIKKEPNM